LGSEEKGHVASRLTWFIIVVIVGALLLPGLGHPYPAQAEPERLVLAFYYSWFDKNTWNGGKVPDLPQTLYNSDNRDAMARQIDQAKGAGIDAFVFNWWGKGNRTEKNLKAMLNVAAEKSFRIAVAFDLNSPFMGGTGSYADNLRHLHTVHAAHPAYLRYQGRPVVFFYNVSRLSVAAWQSIREQADPGHNAIWIAEGTDLKYQSVFDGHHLYSITWPNRIPPSQTLSSWGDRVRKYNRENGTNKLWVATVMPGYDDRKARPGSGFARSRDGGDYYRACWQAAIASKPHWIIVNSFNEWPEGSYIEPSQAYGSLYLDLTREWSGRFKGADFAVNAALPLPPPATRIPPTPSPRPLAPTPTPFPVIYPVEEGQGAVSNHLGVGCGYSLRQDGLEYFWIVHCASSLDLGLQPRLAY
jgi:Glycosyl hydrolase family 99